MSRLYTMDIVGYDANGNPVKALVAKQVRNPNHRLPVKPPYSGYSFPRGPMDMRNPFKDFF